MYLSQFITIVRQVKSSILKVTIFIFMLSCCVGAKSGQAELNTVSGNVGYILHIQMTPAVCMLDETNKKQRKCLEGYAFTVASLVPEMINLDCETHSSSSLSPVQSKVVARLIPDEAYRNQLWKTVGGCMPMNASQYFRTITGYAQNLKVPAILTDVTSHNVQEQQIKEQFVHLNQGLPANAIQFNCQKQGRKTLLTHISVCYKTNGQFKACPTYISSSCPSTFNIQGTY